MFGNASMNVHVFKTETLERERIYVYVLAYTAQEAIKIASKQLGKNLTLSDHCNIMSEPRVIVTCYVDD